MSKFIYARTRMKVMKTFESDLPENDPHWSFKAVLKAMKGPHYYLYCTGNRDTYFCNYDIYTNTFSRGEKLYKISSAVAHELINRKD